MARHISAIEITFNDNDGRVGWSIYPQSAYDIFRHQRIFGKWRTRWILFVRFWCAIKAMEYHVEKYENKGSQKLRLWVFKAEIPE